LEFAIVSKFDVLVFFYSAKLVDLFFDFGTIEEGVKLFVLVFFELGELGNALPFGVVEFAFAFFLDEGIEFADTGD
jgi:hypothetical protein